MAPWRFLVWNLAGAILWVAVFGSAGYAGGHLLTILLDDLRQHEKAVAVLLGTGSAAIILWKTHGRDLRDLWSLRKAISNRP